MSDHVSDAGKMVPWDNELTPRSIKASEQETFPDVVFPTSCVPSAFAQNLERRMRAAERLLDDERQWSESSHDFVDWSHDVQEHLEAAREEDGR